MSSSTPEIHTAAVLTVSDSSARGDRDDLSGPAVIECLTQHGFSVVATEVVPDEQTEIQNAIALLASEVQLVVTTGGTGIAHRDVTPEATLAVCERLLEGVPTNAIGGSEKDPIGGVESGRVRYPWKVSDPQLARQPQGGGRIAGSGSRNIAPRSQIDRRKHGSQQARLKRCVLAQMESHQHVEVVSDWLGATHGGSET